VIAAPLTEVALVGTWQLISYEIECVPGAVIDRPFGRYPHGTLIYTAEGWMSAQAMADARRPCGVDRPAECTPAAKIAAYDSYFGYSGHWTLEGDVVTHWVETSCFPDWTGSELRRQVSVADDFLTLRGVAPEGPQARIPLVRWQRLGV
jgi:hypothetical protein